MTSPEQTPKVGIIMGSDSDLPVMVHAELLLQQFGVPAESRVISAHRTPAAMAAYGNEAADRGLQIIIAGAGGSAHLPGMMASETRLPVLGVAIESAPDPTNAALGSMIRMPEGAPLATIGKNKAAAVNAGLMAVRILALNDPSLNIAYAEYQAHMRNAVMAKDRKMSERGGVEYLREQQAVALEAAQGEGFGPPYK